MGLIAVLPIGLILGSALLFGSTGLAANADNYAAAIATGTTDVATGTTDPADVATGTTNPADVATGTTDVATGTTQLQPIGFTKTDGGIRYYYEDGTYAVGTVKIDGIAYLFDNNGIERTGWRTVGGIRRYYDPETGVAVCGWLELGGERYYIDRDKGKMTGEITVDGIPYLLGVYGYEETGWQEVAGARRYYDPVTGDITTGTAKIDNQVYLFDETGAQKVGWRSVGGIRRYYDTETGEAQRGWVITGGERYYINGYYDKVTGEMVLDDVRYLLDDEYGYQHLGFCTFASGKTSYFLDDGTPADGWLTVKNRQYYFIDQYMVTGWQTIKKKTYYFSESGAMRTSWQTIDDNRYFFNGNGVMATGLNTIGGEKYFFETNGIMWTGLRTIDGHVFYFSTYDGTMQTGWYTTPDTGVTYYFGSDGAAVTGWQTIGGVTYFFGTDGTVQHSWIYDGTDYYYMDPVSGALTTYTYDNNGLSLAYYALKHVGGVYWYGTYGQTASAYLYSIKKNEYPSYYTYTDYATQYGQQVFDCVGLIKGFLWSSTVTGAPVYTASQDVSAKGMFAASSVVGYIDSFPYHVGMLIYKSNVYNDANYIHHVGVYIGNGLVVEAQSHENGIIISSFEDGGWNFWSQCPWIADSGIVD